MVYRPVPSTTIRPMTHRDLPAVLTIERASFSNPWPENSFMEELRAPQALNLVSVENRAVTGYLMGWKVAGEFHLGNIAVAAVCRRRGIAAQLLSHVLGKPGTRCPYRLVTLEVRTGNHAARSLYEKFGFQPVAIRKKYYSDTGEDALVMLRQPGDTAPGMGAALFGTSPENG